MHASPLIACVAHLYVANRAERGGTYVERVVSEADLAKFYAAHDPSKVADAAKNAKLYENKTAQLVRLLALKYSGTPRTHLTSHLN